MAISIELLSQMLSLGLTSKSSTPVAESKPGFWRTVEAQRVEAAKKAEESSKDSDENLSEYQQSIKERISQLTIHASQAQTNFSIEITKEGFEAMENDPDYEKWVLDTIASQFSDENLLSYPNLESYQLMRFGASAEEYKFESWTSESFSAVSEKIFGAKSKDNFWEKRAEKHQKNMELKEEIWEKQQILTSQMMRSFLSEKFKDEKGAYLSGVSAAELLSFLM